MSEKDNVNKRRGVSLEAAFSDDWKFLIGQGALGYGVDLATTTKKKSNPSALAVVEKVGLDFVCRAVVRWKTDKPAVTRAVIERALDLPGALPVGGAPKPGSPKGGVTTLSAPTPRLADVAHQLDAANAEIARAGSADLSRAFGEALGPLHVLVMTSSSSADLEHRLALFAASYPTVRIQPLIEEALEAFTAQGAGTAK